MRIWYQRHMLKLHISLNKKRDMEAYILQLLHDSGVPADLDEATQAQLVADLTARANDLINRRMIESLDDEQLAQFNDILDNHPDDAAAMTAFIDQNVPDKQEIAARALLEFRSLYLGEAA